MEHSIVGCSNCRGAVERMAVLIERLATPLATAVAEVESFSRARRYYEVAATVMLGMSLFVNLVTLSMVLWRR